MIVAGARRHAREILEVLHQNGELEGLLFFDDVSDDLARMLYGKYLILRSPDEAREVFKNDPRFILGLGDPCLRKKLADKLTAQGGALTSLIAATALIGHYDVTIETGVNIMNNTMISNGVTVGEGALINAFASVHHDAVVGRYCEISPHATLLGCCNVGKFCSVGSNATILPDIKIGDLVIVGAGAVVTADLPDYSVAVGVPARIIRYRDSEAL